MSLSDPASGSEKVPSDPPVSARLKRQKAVAPAKTPAFVKVLYVLALLFVFLVGVKGLGSGFKLLGKDVLDTFFLATANPFVGLVVGLLATTLVQSSSVTTSMIVALVAAPENPLPVAHAVPMIMGANIGTTVTNTIVSLAHIRRKDEFLRAFSAATCHDFFNFLTVAILLPLELLTGFLRSAATWAASLLGGVGGAAYKSPVKVALKAAVAPIKGLAGVLFDGNVPQACVVILVSGVLIVCALALIVRALRAAMATRLERYVTRIFARGILLSIVVGIIVTVMVQSSSITTALLVPLAGAGVVTLEQVFPITVGANLGTTVTAFLASMAVSGPNARAGIVIALVHLLFNLSGTLLILPLERVRQIPLNMARRLARLAVRSRKWAVIYVAALFYGLPGALIALRHWLWH